METATAAAVAASSSHSPCSIDVFLSFRGEDVRKSFADHLYIALVGVGFGTFSDNEGIERGENIKSALETAITQSRCSIIILSENYPFSSWCLDELVSILERKGNDDKYVVLPIFYHVDPSDVRNQKGIVADAIARHHSQNVLAEKVKRWTDALRHVADLGGMALQNQVDGHEGKFIKKIVKVIEERLKRTILNVPPCLVGIESRVEHINLWLQDDSSEVRIVALYGTGGVGKTTIAKCVFNINFDRFEAGSFLANIKDVSGLPNGLIRLQTQVLSDILKGKKKRIWNVDEGIIRIREVLSLKKVLLVLDDIDHADQFEAILGVSDSLHPGSKIIITTRHKWLLPCESYKIHEVVEMDFEESVRLFSWYAFGQDYPFDCYRDQSKRVVAHCGGLPLALKVLGSSLRGKEVDVWGSALEKLETITDSQIFKKLVVSYESLPDDHDKNLFLEIACFFLGMSKDYTITVLDGCGFHTVVGIKTLMDQGLLTIDSKNKLTMHQMIRDLGREVIRQESPMELGKRTRLWRYKDSIHVLRENMGTETITGLALDMKMVLEHNFAVSEFTANTVHQHCQGELEDRDFVKRFRFGLLPWHYVKRSSVDSDNIYLATDAFTRMRKLSLLQLDNAKLIGSFEEFPRNLRWLRWHSFPEKYVPIDFPLESLVAMDMRNSHLERVWKGYRLLGSLKILNLSHSHELIGTPDFSSLPQLERLILIDCVSLTEVHESIGSLETKLIELNLKDCRNLRSLPKSTWRLKVLETLVISGCLNLGELPQEIGKMESMKVFCADQIDINPSNPSTSRDGLWYTLGSRWVSRPRQCPKLLLNSLPKYLVSLSLSGCNLNNYSFPPEFSNLQLLENLDLSYNPICGLPDCVRELTNLEILQLYSCTRLEELIDLPGTVDLLAVKCTSLRKITFQSKVRRAPFYCVDGCKKLVELDGFFKLKPLGNLDNELMKSLGMFMYDIFAINNIEVKMFNLYTQTAWRGPIQALFEKGTGNIFFPGGKVLGCFSNTTVGSSVSLTITLPPFSNTMIQGLNVCVVYTNDEHWDSFSRINVVVKNMTKALKFVYSPSCYGLLNDDTTWLSFWKFHPSHLDIRDQLNISVECDCGFKVTQTGVRVVCDDKEVHSSDNFVPKEVSKHQQTNAIIEDVFFDQRNDNISETTDYLLQAWEV